MLNVANLYPDWFAQVADGLKTREYRQRLARDPVLEQVQKYELVVFRETGGSGRAVLCDVVSRRRRTRRDGVTYVITIRGPIPVDVVGRTGQRVALRQGWRRVPFDVDAVRFTSSGLMRITLPWI